jgi:hypothetical protein
MSLGGIIMLFLIAVITWIGFKLRDQGQRIEELCDVLGLEKQAKKSSTRESPGPPVP